MVKNNMHLDECTCLAWRPIFAGTLVAIGLAFLLNLFSMAIGLTAFTTNNDGVESLVLGGLIGTGIGIIASMFVSGWVSGYLGQRHCSNRHLGYLYGFLTWCLALLVTIFIAGHVQQYISGYAHFISGSNEFIQINKAGPAPVNVVVGSVPTKGLVISTYIVFVLFLASAFAATIGGHCGMRYMRNKNY